MSRRSTRRGGVGRRERRVTGAGRMRRRERGCDARLRRQYNPRRSLLLTQPQSAGHALYSPRRRRLRRRWLRPCSRRRLGCPTGQPTSQRHRPAAMKGVLRAHPPLHVPVSCTRRQPRAGQCLLRPQQRPRRKQRRRRGPQRARGRSRPPRSAWCTCATCPSERSGWSRPCERRRRGSDGHRCRGHPCEDRRRRRYATDRQRWPVSSGCSRLSGSCSGRRRPFACSTSAPAAAPPPSARDSRTCTISWRWLARVWRSLSAWQPPRSPLPGMPWMGRFRNGSGSERAREGARRGWIGVTRAESGERASALDEGGVGARVSLAAASLQRKEMIVPLCSSVELQRGRRLRRPRRPQQWLQRTCQPSLQHLPLPPRPPLLAPVSLQATRRPCPKGRRRHLRWRPAKRLAPAQSPSGACRRRNGQSSGWTRSCGAAPEQ